MANIGVFYRDGFDPGAYTLALFHAQTAVAHTAHTIGLYTFGNDGLETAAMQAPEIDGLLTFGPSSTDIKFLQNHDRPSLVCERVVPGCAYVAPDNYDMGRTAATHFLDLGHKRLSVALPGDPNTLDAYHGTRFVGFQETAAAAGQPIADDDIFFGAKEAMTGTTVAETLLARRDLPDAIYVQNLPMALAAFQTLTAAGVSIPNDISFVGTTFTQLNAPMATTHTVPPMTTVTFQKEEMGRLGVEYLCDAAADPTVSPIEVLRPGILIRGESPTAAR